MIANPTATSAAATTILKNTNICAEGSLYILENATSSKFTAFSISSMHMNMIIALRRMSVPMIPMLNKARLKNK
jgi:hypothetical protein